MKRRLWGKGVGIQGRVTQVSCDWRDLRRDMKSQTA